MNTRRTCILAAACLFALSACTPSTPDPATPATTPDASVGAPIPPPPVTDPVDAPMPSSSTPDGDRDLARWDGYDALRFGMDNAAFRGAWGGELKGDSPAEGSTCTHLYPAWVKVPAEFAFMFEGGKFVRYSVENDKLLAPGGGRVGMTRAEIEKLYPGRIEVQPHKYTDGQYLRIADDASGSALVFETNAAGRVTEWRLGVPPQVDYVEGCS